MAAVITYPCPRCLVICACTHLHTIWSHRIYCTSTCLIVISSYLSLPFLPKSTQLSRPLHQRNTRTHFINDILLGNWNLMDNSYYCNSITAQKIAIYFCLCHDSTAVMSRAKFCSDHCIKIWKKAKWNFQQIWTVMKKLSWTGPWCFTLAQWLLMAWCLSTLVHHVCRCYNNRPH